MGDIAADEQFETNGGLFGGIINDGDLTLDNVTVSDNHALPP